MARASDGVRLMDDCQLLEEDRSVAAIRSAVGLSLSDLKKDPRRLVGQLYGRLMAAAGMMRVKEENNETGERKEGERKEGGGSDENKEKERMVEKEISDFMKRLRGH